MPVTKKTKPKKKVVRKRVILACNHGIAGKDPKGNAICPICGCTEILKNPPSLEGRIAKCDYCKRETPSSYTLPFFQHGDKHDSFYCGCRGWD